ncbi:uncharacterized protein LOC110447708 [Mizuhopecten yessoensis]|uniref:Uncharacterized protein n=1 Tax=Mizuhopecten yessoensis TaxID=6573 RepID=A0A210QUX6_MIZYE|nr:uncharacterized protein LOC110447708 [Mizuhopecten yessoensis]XP_021349249.1 uncharacterized protein LOC110447708 [Mizuhopecten yessoensis]XP_021349250.1 uncharacterized protein LOC110447708 [Mizuhopecten yessoensis]XP_021349251.1 uncharacterized protein LOC110447708 [Mizuhopecten yessoensis]OWF52472.1 hypothetical protein KP79_PYT06870 [Mizuhopecten yessoensis]
MPTLGQPSYNSSRVQRAYRINNIENTKLYGRLNILDKEKKRQIQVTNQDIRLISVTLDYINSCSGQSPEGLGPETEEEYEKPEGGPCFLYGERIVSRKRRRFQRPQSAAERSRVKPLDLSDLSEKSSEVSSSTRPQSSPAKSRTFITSLRGDGDIDDVTSNHSDDIESMTSCSRASSSRSNRTWMTDTSDITKKLLRANLNAERHPMARRDSVRQREMGKFNSQNVFDKKAMARKMYSARKPPSRDPNDKMLPTFASTAINKNAGIMDILNQQRPTLSANEWKSHLSHSRNPMTIADQRKQVMDIKLGINEDRRDRINNKVKTFISDS